MWWSLLCLPPLAALAFSDLRCRRIGIFNLAIFAVAVVFMSVMESGDLRLPLSNLVRNLLTCVLLWTALSFWARLRKRGLSDMLGTGDLLFVLCMTPYFPPRHFLLFLIFSSLATILFWLLYTRLSRTTARDIPLVTAFAICLTLQIVIRIVYSSCPALCNCLFFETN